MKTPLKPVKPRRISDQVFDQLKELIVRGQLKPGEQLMPERELAETLGVSRTTVRDAISKLVVMRYLEHRQGQGTFVRKPTLTNGNLLAEAMRFEDATLKDLLEFRKGLECNAAAVAAHRAMDDDIDMLRKTIQDMERAYENGDLGTEADVSFHMAISFASRNPVQIHVMKHFYDYLFYSIRANLTELYKDQGQFDRLLTQHRDVFNAIRAHDPDEAHRAMDRHIQSVIDFLLDHDVNI
ncbi:hypothetical protein D3OALGA1CA_3335 [Olavius algarvensis associated proteobacterium Delta 3]|nr:hypothetical protein D3OALGB2SA_1459 [Olavius algarvensis associated proteobacterium Delta 3]CAB5132747.1 hypothetical protein D3OALGA1CA_3335 [Olavius algarvensis associated proteobacterium Delta 3]